jgi:hypothetical protein
LISLNDISTYSSSKNHFPPDLFSVVEDYLKFSEEISLNDDIMSNFQAKKVN